MTYFDASGCFSHAGLPRHRWRQAWKGARFSGTASSGSPVRRARLPRLRGTRHADQEKITTRPPVHRSLLASSLSARLSPAGGGHSRSGGVAGRDVARASDRLDGAHRSDGAGQQVKDRPRRDCGTGAGGDLPHLISRQGVPYSNGAIATLPARARR